MSGAEALWLPAGEQAWEPTDAARGPWDPGHLHAGPVAGLIARALEALPAPVPMRFTRITLEILRPVALTEVIAEAEVVRHGRRVSLCHATLRAGETELCRASAWRIRAEDGALPGLPAPDPPPAPGPEAIEPPRSPGRFASETFAGLATEQRWVLGDWGLGPSVVWMRLRLPLVAGETTSAAPALCSLADFGNGISAVVPWDGHLFVNTDLTVYLERAPAGEWLASRPPTRLDPTGSGVAESVLFDTTARVGRALQSLYAARR